MTRRPRQKENKTMGQRKDELTCYPHRIKCKESESGIEGCVEYVISGLADININVLVTIGLDFFIPGTIEVQPPFRDLAVRELCTSQASKILLERLSGLLQKETYPLGTYKKVPLDETTASFVEFSVSGLSDLPEEDAVIRINIPSVQAARNIFLARIHLLVDQLES